jgi:hypothetical protein
MAMAARKMAKADKARVEAFYEAQCHAWSHDGYLWLAMVSLSTKLHALPSGSTPKS